MACNRKRSMACYEVIAGSRSYGLELETSDIDICRAAESWDAHVEGQVNVIQVPGEEFLSRIFCRHDNAYYLQWLYPAQVCSDNEASRYLMDRRETITAAQKGAVYRILTAHAGRLEKYSDLLYDRYPKRAAYAVLLYSIAANYARGMTFSQAHRPDEELRAFLLGVRRGEVPLEETMARMKTERVRALAAETFYSSRPDTTLLRDTEEELRQLMALVTAGRLSREEAEKVYKA